jgi:hypothetical protein
MSFRNVDTCLPNYTASHSRGCQSSQTPPRQTKILHLQFKPSSQSSKTKLKSPYKRGKITILCILNFTFLQKKRGRHEVNDVRQTEIQATKPLLPQPKVFEVEMDTEELNTKIARY